MQPKRLWLIRHGLTDHNADGRWQGQLPTELNPTGHKQAHKLAHHLVPQPIEHIFTSDLPRAYQTATPLAEKLGLRPHRDARLREIKLGIMINKRTEEIKAQHQGIFERWDSDDTFAVPRGESRVQVWERAQHLLDELSQSEYENIALVTHGGVIRIIMANLYPENYPKTTSLKVPNTSYTILTGSSEAGWQADVIAHAPHLEN